MRVRDWMTPGPITVEEATPIGRARAILDGHRIRRLPVLRDGRLIGMVSDRDLRSAEPSILDAGLDQALDGHVATPVGRLLRTERLVTVSPDDPLERAAVKMYIHRVGGLPVVDRGDLVGIITETDLLRAMVEVLGFQDSAERQVLDLGAGEPLLWERLRALAAQGHTLLGVLTYRDRPDGCLRAVVRTDRLEPPASSTGTADATTHAGGTPRPA